VGASLDLLFPGLWEKSFRWEIDERETDLEEVRYSRRQQRFSLISCTSDAVCLTALTGQQEPCEPKRTGPS